MRCPPIQAAAADVLKNIDPKDLPNNIPDIVAFIEEKKGSAPAHE